MAVGDLITVSGGSGVQYEWAGVLLGTGTKWLVQEMDGLDGSPDLVTDDLQRNDDHGAIHGKDILPSREITGTLSYQGDNHSDVMAAYRTMARVMRPLTKEYPLAFRRPGEVKKQVFVRPRKRSFPSNSDVAMGLAKGTAVWNAADPRIYSLVENHAQIALAANVAAGSVAITNAGDFHAGMRFQVSGAANAPHIAVSAQTADPLDGTNWNGKTIAIAWQMQAADVLAINARSKDVQLNGANAYNLVDIANNQWWEMMPGQQTVTFSRTNAATAVTLDIYWYDVWL